MTVRSSVPLEEITVVELGQIVAGPFAGQVLADLGAEVVKIERPGTGDLVRNTGESGRAVFNAFNRNKRSLAVDLQSEAGRDAYRDLVATADVVIENLGPGVVDRLGIGYEALSADNPGLVYLSIKGFFEGPYGDRPGMDMVAEAMSGLVAMTGEPGGKPVRVGTSITDIGAALYGTIGVLTALRERDATGEGQRVDASLFASAAQWMGYWVTYVDMVGSDHPPLGSSHSAFAVYDIFETADPEELVFVGVVTERQWPAFCRATGLTELPTDERFETAAARLEHKAELAGIVQNRLHDWTRAELVEALSAENVLAAPVNQPSDLREDPQLHATDLIGEFTGIDGDQLRTVLTPIRGEAMTTEQHRDPPTLGEHSRAVLSEVGYDDATIDALFADSVIESADDR